MKITITHIDTACVLIEINGYRILTDPALDPPGKLYHHGFGAFSRKYSKPAFHTDQLKEIDLVLLSHDQHMDNLDSAGRLLLRDAKTILSTKPASKRIPNVIGLDNWDCHLIETKLVKDLKVTAVPARHGPAMSLPLVGKVVGFVLEWKDQKDGALYISGDTVWFSGIQKIAERFKIDVAILHIGCAKFKYLTGPLHFTFDAAEAVKATNCLGARKMIPIHYEGWTHFSEPIESLKKKINSAGLCEKVIFLEKGNPTTLFN